MTDFSNLFSHQSVYAILRDVFVNRSIGALDNYTFAYFICCLLDKEELIYLVVSLLYDNDVHFLNSFSFSVGVLFCCFFF